MDECFILLREEAPICARDKYLKKKKRKERKDRLSYNRWTNSWV